MRRGRPPLGVLTVEHLEGSPLEKTRLRAILASLSGAITIEEACAQSHVARTRFFALRDRALSAALVSLVPGKPGRRPKSRSSDSARIEELERTVARLQAAIVAERARTELALVMPDRLRPGKVPRGKKASWNRRGTTAAARDGATTSV